MSATPSPVPAPAETIDQRIARLKAELADAELQKLDADMGEAAGAFFGVSQGGSDPVEVRTAIDFVRDAWARFELWRDAHRSESAEIAAERPFLALSPLALPAEPSRQGAAAEVAQAVAVAASAPTAEGRKRSAPTSKRKCSRCGDNGHRAPACWAGRDAAPAPLSPTVEDDDLPRDDALLGELPAAPPVKRPPGSGVVYSTGTGWRWSIRRAGMAAIQGRTFSTEAEALADLDRVVAERAAGAAPPDMISMVPAGLAAKENTCSVCGERGHNARRHGTEDGGAPSQPQAPPAAEEEDPASTARRRNLTHRRIERANADAAPPIAEAPEPDEPEDPVVAWSPADADGRQTCLPCGGEGIDNRPGEGAGRCCLHCDGEGYRWPDAEAPPAAPPPAVPAPRPPGPPAPAVVASDPNYFHPGRGWGPVDASGVSVHGLCNGTGKIRVKGVVRGCFPCESTGKRQCVPRSAPAGEQTP